MSNKEVATLLSSLTILLFLSTITTTESADNLSPAPSPCPEKLGFDPTLIPFNTSGLLCSKVWAAQDFLLMFQHTDDYQTWSFVLSAPNNKSYIAIGFSTDEKMVGSSAVVGWLGSGGKGVAKQYILNGKTAASCLPDAGELDLVKGKTVMFSQSSRVYLAFQLDTSTNQPASKLIYAVGPTGFVPKSDNLLTYHSDRISTSITYVPESNAPAPSPKPESPSSSPLGPTADSSPVKTKTDINSVGPLKLGRCSIIAIPTFALLLVMGLL